MWAVFEYSFQSKSLLCRYLPLLNTKKEKNTKYGSESFVSNAELILIGYNKIVGISVSSPFRAQPFIDRYIVGV